MVLVLLKTNLVITMAKAVKKLVGIKNDFLHLNDAYIVKDKEILYNDFNHQELILSENISSTFITFNKGSQNELFLNAFLKKNATLKVYNIITSNKSSKIKMRFDLDEEGSNVEIINLLLLTKDASLDSFIDIYHHQKHTTSDLTNYAIAKDNAQIILNNNATIIKKSSGSIAHQQTKGLTLTKTTKIKALPNLYIDEYDVVANHACSIGSISKEDLFYLMSRGLTLDEASQIVVMGYVKPILDHIDDELIKQEVEKEFAQKLVE